MLLKFCFSRKKKTNTANTVFIQKGFRTQDFFEIIKICVFICILLSKIYNITLFIYFSFYLKKVILESCFKTGIQE